MHPTHLTRDCTQSDSLPSSLCTSTVSLHIITWYCISYNGSFDLAWWPGQLIFSLEKYNILWLADYCSSVYLTYPLLMTYSPFYLPHSNSSVFFSFHAFFSSCLTGEPNIWINGHPREFLLWFGHLFLEADGEEAIVKWVTESTANTTHNHWWNYGSCGGVRLLIAP